MKRVTPLARLTTLLTLLLAIGVLQPTAVAAQNGAGNNNLVFWDEPPSTLIDSLEGPEADTNLHFINVSGGRTLNDGLLTVVGKGNYAVIRDRDFQTYAARTIRGTVMWMLAFEIEDVGHCFYGGQSGYSSHMCKSGLPGGYTSNRWTSTAVTNRSEFAATMTMTATVSETSVIITVDHTYDLDEPEFVNLSVDMRAEGPQADAINRVKLYLGGDMYLDGTDYGPGEYTTWLGRPIIVQTNDTSVGGVRAVGRDFDSYLADDYRCFFGAPDKCAAGPDTLRGASAGEMLSNYVSTAPEVDIGVGGAWRIGTLPAELDAQLVFASREVYDARPLDAPPEPVDPIVATICSQPPTLALKPDGSTITPGSRMTIWVEAVNTCRDLPTAPFDMLLSLSDGLSVEQTSVNALNLGQRAALQRVTLGAGETLGWYAVVGAANPLPTAPLAIAELYAGAAVVRTAQTELTVAAAPAVEAPAVPAEVPAVVVSEPAPVAALPTTLPNTSAAPVLILPLLGSALLSLLVGAVVRRNRR
jgi:hypothetical protein